ncbi:hypothetical protein GCM10010441_76570 [Kitasatospora paracochleata]|uniref:Uncharacterized protein n=1 Tax=Kitasatospora paracochleata TaxID=58354 RepID=A0ABT1IUK6_9ACTN|nr:hypothetical protein [Kitasatospora paracochleata]MCP2308566.1 hypothetical protein [Kitasatospora paracochleata]
MNVQPSATPPTPSARPTPQKPRFPLPQRHRRVLACAAVAASVALGTFGVGATVETVRGGTAVTASSTAR